MNRSGAHAINAFCAPAIDHSTTWWELPLGGSVHATMRRFTPSLAVLLQACAATPPQGPPTATPAHPPIPVASSDHGIPLSSDPGCELRPRLLPASTPATWGDVRPGVWLLEGASGGHEVFFPSSYNGPYHQAILAPHGSLQGEAPLALFSGLGEVSYPAVVRLDGGLVSAVTSVYVASQNADIYVAIRRSGRWSTPLPVMPGAELDTDVTAAAGHGRIALAWNRGAYPSAPDLAFALVEPDGKGSARVVTADVIEPDVQAEGKTLVAVPDGWILFYTPSSALRAESRGLFAISLDRDGNQRGHSRLLGGPVLWPVGAARGDRIGVAFTASTPLADEDVGACSVRIVRSGASVRGVYVEDRGDEHLRAFDLDCDAPEPTPVPEDACAAKTEAFVAGRLPPP